MGVSLHSLVRRIPMALGPVLGGALIVTFGETTGIRSAFVVALIFAGFSLLLQQWMIAEKKPGDRSDHNAMGLSLVNPALRNLLVSDILIRFCEQIPYAFVVIWCVTIHKITALQFGLLTTIEMITAMLVYIPVAYLADKNTKKPYVLITFGFFTLFPLMLLFAKSFWVMVLAFVIRGLKEFGEPTRKALIMDLAPENRKAATFGVYYLIRDVVVSVAAFGGAFLWDAFAVQSLVNMVGRGQGILSFVNHVASPALNLLTAFGFGVLGTVYFAWFGKDLGHISEITTTGKRS